MSREIKFKFWLGHNKKMTYPHYLNEVGAIMPFFPKDIITLQFTGLLDKHGKEIFEGDICKTYNVDELSKLVDTVVFDEGSFVFRSEYKLDASLRGFKTDYIEIIGNIFENPELIK